MSLTAKRLTKIPALALLLLAAPAIAGPFKAMPELDAGSKHLQIRWVKYNGGTNGEMVVDVKNIGTQDVGFSAEGLYFVPAGDPEKAPQRLGASGPFRVKKGKRFTDHVQDTVIAPGATKRLSLSVFCIDSHRSSPNPRTRFSVATQRLPKELRKELETSNDAIYEAHGGDVEAAKGAVQSNMWKTRDKKWIKLQGERKQEKSAPSPSQRLEIEPQELPNVPQQQRRK